MNHIPVMTKEVLKYLVPKEGEVYVDGSFGGGGHTRAVLECAQCSVVALDKDPDAIKRGRVLQEAYPNRLTLIHGCFSSLEHHLAETPFSEVDGVSFDAGVSSFQLEESARGFSFSKDGALDMRMDNSSGETASDYVNRLSQWELAHIFKTNGEEKFAKRIARAIVKERHQNPITTTKQLADIISAAYPARPYPHNKIHPATRCFQALRIFVNDELAALTEGLEASEKVLKAGGRLVVVSFHSLEDRIVKRFLQKRSSAGGAGVSRFVPLPIALPKSARVRFDTLTKSPITPSLEEIGDNPRARSAKLRAAIKQDEAARL